MLGKLKTSTRAGLAAAGLAALVVSLACGGGGGNGGGGATPTPTPPSDTINPGTAGPFTTEAYTWLNVTIVGGGFVPGIIFNSAQRDLVYARTDIGGAYRWDASARRWIPLTDWISGADWNLMGIESIATDPVETSRVYLAAGTYTQSWATNGAILRSSDKGQTWQRTDLTFKLGGNEDGRSMGERLAIDPHLHNRLYFGSRRDGLWRSDDYAATWSRVTSFPVTGDNAIGLPFVVFDTRSGTAGAATPTLYVGVASTSQSLYRSTDAGATWQAVPGQPTGFLPHHAAFDSAGVLYLTYGNGPGPNGVTDGAVWKYTPATGNWIDITPLEPGGSDAFGYAGLGVDASHAGTVMVSTLDRWNRRDEVFRTTDGGASWTAVSPKSSRDSSASPYLNWGEASAGFGHWIGDVEIDPFDASHVLYVTGATIWASNDVTGIDAGQTTHWKVGAVGLEETAVLDLLSPPSGAHLISALGDIAGFRHDDLSVSPQGGLWTNPIFSTTSSIDFAAADPSVVVRVGYGSARRGAYSLDGGSTWTPFAGAPAGEAGFVAVSADGGTIVWAPDKRPPSYSKDRGTTWTLCGGLSGFARVVADGVNAQRFYAIDSATGIVYASTDGGASFASRAGALPTGATALSSTPGHEGDLWLATGIGLYRSSDGGGRFTRMATAQAADGLGFGAAAPGKSYPALYIGGRVDNKAGVFRSDDAGLTWVRINDDQHQYGGAGRVITGDPRVYGRVYCGANGRGVLYAEPAQ